MCGVVQPMSEADDWALDKSIHNMLHYYRNALLRLRTGGAIVDSVPQGTRKRLCEYGVIRKFGTKFELTDLGTELLQVGVSTGTQ
jgi:hypothetical protein